VLVRDEDGREQRFEIVSSQTAAPAEGRISIESPVARGLIGLAVGQQAQVSLAARLAQLHRAQRGVTASG